MPNEVIQNPLAVIRQRFQTLRAEGRAMNAVTLDQLQYAAFAAGGAVTTRIAGITGKLGASNALALFDVTEEDGPTEGALLLAKHGEGVRASKNGAHAKLRGGVIDASKMAQELEAFLPPTQ